jgi:membrane glycosyltransferase
MNEQYTLEPANSTSVKSVAIRYGLLTGFVTVIYSFILFVGNLSENKILSSLSYVILIVGIILAHKHFKKENGGYMSFGQGLGIGTLLSVILGLMSGIFMYIYIKFIDSSFLERMREMQVAELEKRNMSDEQIEQAMAITDKMMGPEMMVVWAIVATLVMGFLLSLIISAITKHTRPDYE